MQTVAVFAYWTVALAIAVLTCVGLLALGVSVAVEGVVFPAMLFGAFYLGDKLEVGGP